MEGSIATKSPKNASPDKTRTRFLNAAETLFAERGYQGTTIRTIARLSNAPLSSLSHYWGNKQALFKEVCVRRFSPVRAEQMRRFVAIRDDLDAGRAVDIRVLLRALVEPSLNMDGMSEEDRATYRALYGRAYTEPSPEVLATMREIYDEDGHLMLSLMRRLCPDLTPQDFFWRANSTIGALVISLAYGDRLAAFLGGEFGEPDWTKAADSIVNFLAAGMLAAPAQS